MNIFSLAFGRSITALGILILGVGVDLCSKLAARALLSDGQQYSVFWLLHFKYVENPYGFLGVFQAFPDQIRSTILTTGVGLLLTLGLCALLFCRSVSSSTLLSGTLIITGGFANLFDRILHNGSVTDFLWIGSTSLQSSIFNIADIFILTGSFCLGSKIALSTRI